MPWPQRIPLRTMGRTRTPQVERPAGFFRCPAADRWLLPLISLSRKGFKGGMSSRSLLGHGQGFAQFGMVGRRHTTNLPEAVAALISTMAPALKAIESSNIPSLKITPSSAILDSTENG